MCCVSCWYWPRDHQHHGGCRGRDHDHLDGWRRAGSRGLHHRTVAGSNRCHEPVHVHASSGHARDVRPHQTVNVASAISRETGRKSGLSFCRRAALRKWPVPHPTVRVLARVLAPGVRTREAFGLRPVYRRFGWGRRSAWGECGHGAPGPKAVLKHTQSKRWRGCWRLACGLAKRVECTGSPALFGGGSGRSGPRGVVWCHGEKRC